MPNPEENSPSAQFQSVFREALPLDTKLERARTELLDLSARNRLLNIPRSAKSARSIGVIDEKSVEIYRLLVKEAKSFTFLPGRDAVKTEAIEASEEAVPDEIAELAQPDDASVDERGIFARHSDTRLQTRLTSKALQKRLLELYTDAIMLEQEQGVNILYLVLGTLKWIDPKDAELVRYAPLVLVPVTLERGTAAERFKLKARIEDVSSNLSLEAYLDRVHKIRLPEFDATDEFDPSLYMGSVADAVRSKERWEVCEDDIVLGFFSFAKFLMYRDLDPECWPSNARIVEQPLVRSLLADGFATQDQLTPEDANLDDLLKPADMVHIVDCDSSQALAVHEVRRGTNLVIQGPPGTGKSQTIANVIASAVADGKTVLFVAEKMAALDVVKRRLDQAGVGDACLELHSNKANKRQLLQELSRTWDLGSPRGAAEDTLNSSLLSVRNELNGFVSRLHVVHERAGLTPFQVMGELSRLQADGMLPTEYPLLDAAVWTQGQRKEREELLDDLRVRIILIGHPSDHAWRGVNLPPLLPTDVARLAMRLDPILGAFRSYLAKLSALAATLQSPEPESIRQAIEMEQLARRVATAPRLSGAALRSEAWAELQKIEALIDLGIKYRDLVASLHGRVTDEALRLDRSELASAIHTLSVLPQALSKVQLSVVTKLLGDIPRLREAAASLTRLIRRTEPLDTLQSVELLLQMATQVLNAPDVSARAFANPKWETEVERAHDIAEALSNLEQAKEIVGNQVSDAGWQADLGEARQILGQYGTSLTRFFSGRWRQQNRFVNSFMANPKAPLNHKLALLDALQRGRKASAEIDREKEFGSEIFGPEWRGAKSASSHLLALTEWMRGLSRFSMSSDRTMIRSLAASRMQSEVLEIEIAKLERFAREFRSNLTAISQVISADRSFEELEQELGPIADADALLQRAVTIPPSVLFETVSLMRTIEEVVATRAKLADSNAMGVSSFGEMWQSETSDWVTMSEVITWISKNQDIRWIVGGVEDCSSLSTRATEMEEVRESRLRDFSLLVELLHWDLQSVEGGPAADSIFLRPFEARLNRMLEEREQLSHWTSYQERSKRAKELGLRDFVGALEAGSIAGPNLLRCFHASYYEGLLHDQMLTFPELARFDGMLHERNISSFRSMDLQHIKAASLAVARTHHRCIPTAGGIGPVGILRGEIARRRAHMPIRQLMLRAAPVVQALKPVMMMSPLSVAQFLSPGHMTFDLLVMDEASQIQPVDALGAIARCRQIVVVGDERQLPPTQFFSKMTSDSSTADEDDETAGAQVGDVESILGLCLARGLPQRMLRWHYRSRHQSLIAVSNSQFYENKLRIIPSPYTREAGTGLRFIHIANGVFESSSSGANLIEAKAIAEAVIRHALDHPEHSLGVATFSVRQRKAILDHLEAMRRINPLSEQFFAGHPSEPFFIKNLENVQGDERDVIFISVGYGRNEKGFFAMRFGPLGTDGGERRLNVLISRAKRRCDVFASITDEDIDTDRAKGKGVVAFKLFLHYARTGHLEMGRFASEDPSVSAMGDQVENVIQAQGYQVHRHVGLSGLFIDIAVADPERPGRYVLGIELDGPSYANAQSARDRDRLRNAVLLDHGWLLHRIWAMDWLQRPAEQAQKLLHAIEEARETLRHEGLQKRPVAVPVEILTIERGDTAEFKLEALPEAAPNFYVEATLRAVPTFQDLHSASPTLLAKFVEDVVTIEGPVHRDEVVVRIRSAWNLLRSGGRIQSALDTAIQKAIREGLVVGADFLQIEGKESVPRDRSLVNSPGLRRVEMLPPEEIDAGILSVIDSSMGGTGEQVIQSVSRMLGFKSTSSQLRDAIDSRKQLLVTNGRLVETDGMLSILR